MDNMITNEIMETYDIKKMVYDLSKQNNFDEDWLHFTGVCPLCGMTTTDIYENEGRDKGVPTQV